LFLLKEMIMGQGRIENSIEYVDCDDEYNTHHRGDRAKGDDGDAGDGEPGGSAAPSSDSSAPAPIAAPTIRHDGWLPSRQRAFLESLAETGVVQRACEDCGMSARAAYSLRRRSEGVGFNLGWEAAILIARGRLVDTLMERALIGWDEIVTRFGEGSDERVRHRIDNRLAMSLLGRLDKRAEVPLTEGTQAVLARIVADNFDAFLDMIESGATGAAISLFLALRTPQETAEKDAFGRCELCGGDDPATALQTPQSAEDTKLSPAEKAEKEAAELSVWCLRDHDPNEIESWRCEFPPPPGFDGEESGPWDEYDETSVDCYTRDLTFEEFDAIIAKRKARQIPFLNAAIAARDAYFGFVPEAETGPRVEPDWALIE
jgi:hypothetical protein